MKKLLFVALSTLIGSAALASAPLYCYDTARMTRNLSSSDALSLCMGATSDFPVQCFDLAAARNVNGRFAFSLCRKSYNFEPINCLDNGMARGDLGKADLVELCSQK